MNQSHQAIALGLSFAIVFTVTIHGIQVKCPLTHLNVLSAVAGLA